MSGEQEFLLLGSPVISPKAPRKILAPSFEKGIKSDERLLQPSLESLAKPIFKSFPLSRTDQVQTVIKAKSTVHEKESPLRRGRSILSDGGRRGRSPVDWEGQQHWSEVKLFDALVQCNNWTIENKIKDVF